MMILLVDCLEYLETWNSRWGKAALSWAALRKLEVPTWHITIHCNPKYLCIANSISIQIHEMQMLFHLTMTDFFHASIMPTHHSALVKALETIYGAAFLQNHCVSWVLHCSNIKMATLTSKKCSVFKSNQNIVLAIFKSDLSFKNSSNDHARGQRGWQVLHAVHHKVHLRQRCSSSHSYSTIAVLGGHSLHSLCPFHIWLRRLRRYTAGIKKKPIKG